MFAVCRTDGFSAYRYAYYRIEGSKLVPTEQGDDSVPVYVEDYTGRIALSERPEGRKLTALLQNRGKLTL